MYTTICKYPLILTIYSDLNYKLELLFVEEMVVSHYHFLFTNM